MKKFYLIGPLFLFLSSIGLQASPPEVRIRPLEFAPPHVERVVLKNEVVAFLLEDHELPLFDLVLRIKINPALEPVPDAFTVMDSVWRSGGTKHVPPAELERRLENMASTIDISLDSETASLSMACLSRNREESLNLFLDVLFHPQFHQTQLELAKEKGRELIRKKNETPGQIAKRAFRDVLYGPTHEYAREPSENTLKRVNRNHLREFHRRLMASGRVYLAAAGDFNKEKLISHLEKSFDGWDISGKELPPYDYSVQSPPKGSIFYIEKDFTQSRIIFGRIGPSRHQPDHHSMKIADYILGGGGPSRLFAEIRSRRGLAYVVGSFFVEREGPGMIGVVCQSMAPATFAAVEAIRNELDKFSSHPPSQEEMDTAKDATINSFVFGFNSVFDIANARANEEYEGHSSDYLDTYTDKIAAVSQEDVFRIGKKYYSSEGMKIVIVGDKQKFSKPMDSIGEVNQIPLDQLN